MFIRIYTDGACSGNPGVGGYACIISIPKGIKMFSGGEKNTTNNRMELKGVISGLYELYKLVIKYKTLKEVDDIEIISDSAYVINALNKGWLYQWEKNGWITSNGKSVKNVDLWLELKNYVNIFKKYGIKNIRFVKVKGHSGVSLNEECDKMARKEIIKIKEAKS